MVVGPVGGYSVAIVGASGAVGQELLRVLERRSRETKFPVGTLRLFGSSRSAGRQVESTVFGTTRNAGGDGNGDGGSSTTATGTPSSSASSSSSFLTVELFSVDAVRQCHVVFLAVSGSFALEHAKTICAGDDGPVVIDNSSAFRYDDDIPLIVPEINGDVVVVDTTQQQQQQQQQSQSKLIANPNCTTAIGVMAIAPLIREFGLKRLLMSTYQAASGAGQPGMEELVQGTKDQLLDGKIPQHKVFVHPLPFNVIPHIDAFQDNGYTKEEMKVTWETRKICRLPSEIPISCTAVRIPTLRAHAEVIVVETTTAVDVDRARSILESAPGVDVVDDPSSNRYPMPLTATGQYNVQVGRLRQSLAFGEYGLEFFVCGDQLLRGAALNAVLIAEELHNHGRLVRSSSPALSPSSSP